MQKTKKRIIGILLLALLCVIAIGAGIIVFLLTYRYPLHHLDVINKYAEEYELDPALVCAVIHAESRFDADAVSRVGASGLMQITEDTANWLAPKIGMDDFTYDRIFDPETNIRLGCFYLNMLRKQYGSLDTALCAYNAGSGNVDKWLRDPEYSDDGETLKVIPFPETRGYVEKISNNQGIYAFVIKLRGWF